MKKTTIFKYNTFLSEILNCPSDNFSQTEKIAFRWVHKNIDDSDFTPINLIKEPPQRILDDSDLHCMGFGLSFFDTKENAKGKFLSIFNRLREPLKIGFIAEKGNFIAEIILEKTDGVADNPVITNYGHFTFHEYENVELKNKVLSTNLIVL
jgi:hypothetical protein